MGRVWLKREKSEGIPRFEREMWKRGLSPIPHFAQPCKEGELKKENNVHFLHVNGVKKPVPFYSLDVIISVGYRVKSKRGVEFRKWANGVLKEYLIKGYAVNKRMRHEQIAELRQLVSMLGRVHRNEALSTEESEALFEYKRGLTPIALFCA